MSEPPNTSAIILVDHHHYHHQPPHTHPQPLISSSSTPSPSPTTSIIREYRKGNWTLHETLVLITAKKLDDERRTKASTTPPDPTSKPNKQSSSSSRTAELRWKWVENYCWKNGCLRSQNQCNDKWDNLLRDYKKVRDYESRSDGSKDFPSYWQMEKFERKDRNLPTSLLSDVYEALYEVVHHRYPTKPPPPQSVPIPVPVPAPASAPASASASASASACAPASASVTLPIVRPPPPPPPPPPPQPPVVSETSDTSETDRSERLESGTKRKKISNLGSSIKRSATVLARTLLSCEEKKDKRHQSVMEIEKRRLQIEESRNEMNRQGIASLISAVNNLSGAIQALVSDRHNTET